VINEQATVVAVSRDGDHRFSKPQIQEILLLAGLGVHGDAHAGTTVQHRSRVAADPTQPRGHRAAQPVRSDQRFPATSAQRRSGRDGNGEVMREAGIMGIVVTGGRVAPGDGIVVCLPAEPHRALERVGSGPISSEQTKAKP